MVELIVKGMPKETAAVAKWVKEQLEDCPYDIEILIVNTTMGGGGASL